MMAGPDGILPNISRKNPENEYELLKQIGSGTYGEVYKAKVVKTGQLCALKIIKIEPGEDFNIIQQEIYILSECKHRNIVGYLGSYLRKDRLWIAMEFCGGGSLQDIYHAQGTGLNELQIAFVCRETLQGLDYLHQRNKMHRDIKGANILLTDDGDVKLADFGIAAQLTQTLVKRKSFIGTPYWMAPEVAAVERKGGYNHQCDIWAVGITAIELAETQPPMFDLHPMRALYLMTKRNFRPPTLQHKNKWSNNFHDFLAQALKKDPLRRPTAHDLLKHDFVNREALSAILMVPLIRVLEAPPPKAKSSITDEGELDEDEEGGPRKDSQMKRISSVKHHNRIDRQKSEVAIQEINLPPPKPDPAQGPIPAWLEAAAEPYHRPRIQKLPSEAISQYDNSDPEYQSVDQVYQSPDETLTTSSPVSGQPHGAPPVPPRGPSAVSSRISKLHVPDVEDTTPHVYGNVGHSHNPPVPPRKERPSELQTTSSVDVPPVPPRLRGGGGVDKPQQSVRGKKRSDAPERKAYFSKIFNGCPLKLICASSWTHPTNQNLYVILGAEEGLFSLHANTSQDPVMEQISPRACHWLRVVENVLIWLSGSTRMISMTNLILLFQNETQRASVHRNRSHTSKIPDSKGCYKCSIARNPFTDQRYLLAAVPRGILVMQWYQPRHAFMHVKLFECSLPDPLDVFEAFVIKDEEYPSVCIGVKETEDNNVVFNKINLNSGASWFDTTTTYNSFIVDLQQLEKDTIFVATEYCAKFVDVTGCLKPSGIQASQLFFERKAESMVFLQNCVLSFHKHGMQGKSLHTQQVTAEVADGSKIFHLLGSHGTIIIETKQADDLSGPSNLYILVSEEQHTAHS